MQVHELEVAAALADGRFPSGGHAHSAGFEAADAIADLHDPIAFEAFLQGRLATTGATEAHLIAALGARLGSGAIDWTVADVEVTARIMSPALRSVSRMLGRQWVRAALRLWPHPAIDDASASHADGPHQVAANAATFHAAGLDLLTGITLHLHHLAATVTTAAIRLHGLDPYEAQRRQLATVDQRRAIADAAVAAADAPWRDVPAWTGPLTEICAEVHATADGRLFQS